MDLNQTGNPVYPDRGQPEHRYSPGAEDFSNKTRIMEGVLSQCKEALKTFFTSLPAADQATVSLEAKTAFLKNPAVWLAGYRNPGQNNDQEEEEEEEEEEDRSEPRKILSLMEKTMVIARKVFEMQKIMATFPRHLGLQETL